MKFLVIDDNVVDLLIAKAAVQKYNKTYSTVTASGVDEGIAYLQENKEQLPDIILLDLNMPVKNGWDFLKEYKKLNIRDCIKIYILSSSVNENEKLMAANNPIVTGFLSKPLRLDTMGVISEATNLSA